MLVNMGTPDDVFHLNAFVLKCGSLVDTGRDKSKYHQNTDRQPQVRVPIKNKRTDFQSRWQGR